MKKHTLAGGAVAVLIPGPAMAADLARPRLRAPVAMIAPATWTGFYVGVNAGYGWSNNDSVNR
jgi:outer membrane immunogenic protein